MEESAPNLTPKPNPFTAVTPISKALALILFISLPFLGFYLGMRYQNIISSSTNLSLINNSPVNNFSNNKCQSYGWSNGEKSLPTYTVRSGDTLLSVAKDQLKDVSRVEELINLNKATYPSLSLKSPFIEIGWILLLPPEKSTSTSGNIKQMDGDLIDTQGAYAWMIYSPSTGGTGPFKPSTKTNLPQTPPQKGDCVSMVYDQTTGTVYSILSQRASSPSLGNQATPSASNETPRWKTYTNEKYGFSFKFPDSFFVNQSPYASGVVLASPDTLTNSTVYLSVAYKFHLNYSSLDEFLKSSRERESFAKTKAATNIGGTTGYKIVFDYVNPQDQMRRYVYEGVVTKGGNLYSIVLSSFNQDSLNKLEMTFDQILSTFKFLP